MLHNLEKSIRKNPDQHAFCIRDVFYTYAEFAQVISNLRQTINATIPEDEKIVGVLANDDLETYGTLIALWLEGKAYLPINPGAPISHNSSVLSKAQVTTIVSSTSMEAYTGYSALDSTKQWHTQTDLTPNRYSSKNLAYILFTSGTTGQPKGVPITHENITAFVRAFNEMDIDVSSNDRCLQMFDLSFDLSVFSYLIPLLNGACIYTVPTDEVKYAYVYKLLEEQRLTITMMVPSVMNFLLPFLRKKVFPELRYSLFCGEALTEDKANQWSNCSPNAAVFNVYGPTEGTVFCSHYLYNKQGENKSQNGVLSIGKPFGETRFVLIDENDEELAGEGVGELCLEGVQLTAGYWKEKEITTASFLQLPGHSHRYYRTGDLCKKDLDGHYFYMGRKDHQVKIEGFRVELSAIEHHMVSYDNRYNMVVIAKENRFGNNELIAVIEAKPFDLDNLWEHLTKTLPKYMIPSQIKFINQIPLSVNGKIDRKQLSTDI